MTCPSCGLHDHQRSSSKLCPKNSPRPNRKPPDKNCYKTDLKVYKIGLEKLCLNQNVRDSIIPIINVAVKNCSQICFESSHLLLLHIQRCLLNNLDLPSDITDRTFLRQFFTLVSGGTIDDAEITSTFNDDYVHCRNLNFKASETFHYGQIITNLVKEYSTNMEIHIDGRFRDYYARKLKFLFLNKWGMNFPETLTYIENIMSDEDVSSTNEFLLDDPHMAPFIEDYRRHAETYLTKLQFLYHDALYMYKRQLNFIGDKEPKWCTLVPLYNLSSKYITLDTDSLYDLFKHLPQFRDYVGKTKPQFGALQDEVFQKLFKIPDPLFAKSVGTRRFNYMIKTDGVSCSVFTSRWKYRDEELQNCKTKKEKAGVYRRREEERMKKQMEELKEISMSEKVSWIGVDPGKKDVMTIAKCNSRDEPLGIRHFSNVRYYTESRFSHRMSMMKKLEKEYGLEEWNLQIPSLEFPGTETTKTYLHHMLSENFTNKLNMTTSKKYKKLRWTCYIENKKTVDRFCSEVLEDCIPEKTIICFGNANLRNMKGCAPSPKQERFVKALLRKNARVMMTNEFNTSQVCNSCKSEKRLEGCKSATNSHYVRRCMEKSCRMLWNRDVNAAWNIIEVGRDTIMKKEKAMIFRMVLPKKCRMGGSKDPMTEARNSPYT